MIALPVLMVVRVIGVFVFAAGVGALVAGIVSRFLTVSVNVAWAASVLGFALTLAFVFISASVGAVLLMPAANCAGPRYSWRGGSFTSRAARVAARGVV